MDRKKFLVVGLLASTTAILGSPVAQEEPSKTSIDEALSRFLTAFDNLDWQAFRNCFSNRATIFHPAAPNIRRIDSPDPFEKAWLGVFERIKKSSGRTSPPYMNLTPLDLRVEKLCEDVALVTFHLIDGRTVSRRTLVFKRDAESWKIVHIHASNITAP
jgi:ketosteroid isomerase-like protein